MNYLAHLYLAERSGTSAAGNFLGDFVKGRPEDRYSSELAVGIRLHRRIDTLTDAHPGVRHARRLMPRPHRRYAGILLDMWFDHVLAREWPRWHPTPLPAFAAASASRIADAWPATDAPFPASQLDNLAGLLCSYRRAAGIERGLRRIGARLRRAQALERALPALLHHDALLAGIFEQVLIDVVTRVRTEATALRAAATDAV